MGAAGEGKEGQGVGFLEAGLVGPLHSSQRCFQSVRAKLCRAALLLFFPLPKPSKSSVMGARILCRQRCHPETSKRKVT